MTHLKYDCDIFVVTMVNYHGFRLKFVAARINIQLFTFEINPLF